MRGPASPEPPTDPRAGWDLPAFGQMEVETDVDELSTRILAPNPSPMTLDGTNTYVIGQDGGGCVVLDPGPDDDQHLGRVEEVLRRRELECQLVLVTHHHADHTEAAAGWARRFGCRLAAPTQEVAGPDGHLISAGDVLGPSGAALRAVPTPGHSRDHTSYRAPTGALFSGDHVLGRGTSVVAHPDGDLAAYLESLRRVLDLGPDALLPGHGPVLRDDPDAVLEYYLAHREFRQQQIVAWLETDGTLAPRQLVERIYADVDERLWDAAEASTRAALDALASTGHVGWDGQKAWAT